MIKFLFLSGFIMIGLSLLYSYLKVRKLNQSVIGKPTINFWFWITGKICILFPSVFIIMKLAGLKISMILSPWWIEIVSAIIFVEACLIFCIALLHLGESTRVGLPSAKTTKLQTSGLYNVSRNPIYLGLIILGIAANLYVPNLINLLVTIIGVVIHHRIILSEERFLKMNFGDEWSDYVRSVRRYL